MINMVKLPTKKSDLFLRVAKGHFATSHSHINYYIDVTTQKARLSEAKAVAKELARFIHPRNVRMLKLEGKKVEHETLRTINIFLTAYFLLFALSTLLISLDNFDLITSFTSVAATLNNIGPGLEIVGPMSNFSAFSGLSKCVLMFDMLAGRLELFPMLLLFVPATWKRN